MKVYNTLDGANRIVEDATHRFVTDTEKSTWNGKQNAITNSLDFGNYRINFNNGTNKLEIIYIGS